MCSPDPRDQSSKPRLWQYVSRACLTASLNPSSLPVQLKGGLVVGVVVGGFVVGLVVGGLVAGGRCWGAGDSASGPSSPLSVGDAAPPVDEGHVAAAGAPPECGRPGSVAVAAATGAAKPSGAAGPDVTVGAGAADAAAAGSAFSWEELVVAANAAIPLTRVAVTVIDAANADRLGTVIPPRTTA